MKKAVLALTVLLALVLLALIPAFGLATAEATAARDRVQAHLDYQVSHPGWSFPARLVIKGKDGAPDRVIAWLIGPDGELREHLPYEEAPKHLIDAIVAAEDRAYWEHHGVNLKGMARAAWANAQTGSYAQGGSTLTMQVVRGLGGQREKTVDRKLREMAAAWGVDQGLGKEKVLQAYLDTPYLGQRGSISVCGFQAGARHYFGKDAKDLDLSEAATLAGILPSPGRYAPDRHPDEAKVKRDRVLDAMHEVFGYEVAEAKAQPLVTVPPAPLPEEYPIWVSATRAWLESQLPPEVVYGSGLVVELSIDPVAQDRTEALFAEKLKFYGRIVGTWRTDQTLQAAGVFMDVDTGLIRAIYGGTDVTATSFNRATQARRQPGSAFKPLTYALAFEKGLTADHTVPNSPRKFKTPQGDWSPRNVGGGYTPTATLAYGLAWSQNIATASLLEEMGGPKALIALAKRLGYDTSTFPEEMGLALGQAEVTPLDMARFCAIVANGGRMVQGRPVLRAVDAAGVERIAPPAPGEQVLEPKVAKMVREMMRLVIEQGTGGSSRGTGGEGGYAGQAMGKTGTTDSEKDLWFVGATPRHAMVVWLGYDQPVSTGASASDLAAPLWGWWMGRLTKGEKELPKFDDSGVKRRWMCTISGKSPNATCQGISAPFLEGTTPAAGTCPLEHPPPEEGHPDRESLWERLAREAEEAAQHALEAAGGAIEGAAPPPAP